MTPHAGVCSPWCDDVMRSTAILASAIATALASGCIVTTTSVVARDRSSPTSWSPRRRSSMKRPATTSRPASRSTSGQRRRDRGAAPRVHPLEMGDLYDEYETLRIQASTDMHASRSRTASPATGPRSRVRATGRRRSLGSRRREHACACATRRSPGSRAPPPSPTARGSCERYHPRVAIRRRPRGR